MYFLGPFQNERPVKAEMIDKLKRTTNFPGLYIIVRILNAASKRNTKLAKNAIRARIQFDSFGKK